jgi:FKBP-type peptidyl-prolyl cis-trans isomerase
MHLRTVLPMDASLVARPPIAAQRAEHWSEPSLERVAFAPALSVDLSRSIHTSGMYYRDRTLGTGDPVSIGAPVTVCVRGWRADGVAIDSGTPRAFTFRLGTLPLFRGFDVGLQGMRVGGRRQLIVPASLGYGSRGAPGIPANTPLVFEVDLVGPAMPLRSCPTMVVLDNRPIAGPAPWRRPPQSASRYLKPKFA